MRSSRLIKYRRKYRKLIIATQLVAIWYALIVSVSMLSTNTSAYYSTSDKVTTTIQSGEWVLVDESDLKFIGPTQNLDACLPAEISVQIKNNGTDMIDSTEYKVFYSDKNGENHIKNGEIVGTGTLEPLSTGKTTTLTYQAEKAGYYMFMVEQPNDNLDAEQEIWSKKVMIHTDCEGQNGNNGENNQLREAANSEEEEEAIKEDKSSDEQKEPKKATKEDLEESDSNDSNEEAGAETDNQKENQEDTIEEEDSQEEVQEESSEEPKLEDKTVDSKEDTNKEGVKE